jgi:hypothetical protein
MANTIPGNTMQDRMLRMQHAGKNPALLGSSSLDVVILRAYDADTFDTDGVPDELAHLVSSEPGTMFAKVRVLRPNGRNGRKLWVPFLESEAHIQKTFGNAVLLKGMQATIVYTGLRPEQGRLVMHGEPKKPLRGSGGTFVFDVLGNLP